MSEQVTTSIWQRLRMNIKMSSLSHSDAVSLTRVQHVNAAYLHWQHARSKYWYLCVRIHGVTFQALLHKKIFKSHVIAPKSKKKTAFELYVNWSYKIPKTKNIYIYFFFFSAKFGIFFRRALCRFVFSPETLAPTFQRSATNLAKLGNSPSAWSLRLCIRQ